MIRWNLYESGKKSVTGVIFRYEIYGQLLQGLALQNSLLKEAKYAQLLWMNI